MLMTSPVLGALGLGSVPGMDSFPGLVSLDFDDFSCFRCSGLGSDPGLESQPIANQGEKKVS